MGVSQRFDRVESPFLQTIAMNEPTSDGETSSPWAVFNASFENATDSPSLAPTFSPDNQFFVQLASPSVQPSYGPPTTPPSSLKSSPELTQLGFTLGFSTAILGILLLAFGLAMRLRYDKHQLSAFSCCFFSLISATVVLFSGQHT